MKTNMKITFPFSPGCPIAPACLIFGAILLFCASASAQLKNGNFESEFPVSDPTAGWTLVYVQSDPADLAIAGGSMQARRGSSGRGAHLKAATAGPAHAYFKQVVTNLTAGASYTLTIQRMQAAFQNYIDNGKVRVFASLVSGGVSNSVAGDGSATARSVAITAGGNGQIEVQLHMEKLSMPMDTADDYKSSKCAGWFDDASLALTP